MELQCIRDHEIWKSRNEALHSRLVQIFRQEFLPNNRLSLSIDRCKIATGFGGISRVGLVFSGRSQQDEMVEDFAKILIVNGHSTFSLVGTGTSFQVLSTNPVKPDDWCFGQGKLDLDLQIYCPSLVQKALIYRIDLFPNMYDVLYDPLEVRLSTFYNYSAPEKGVRGLNAIAPWVHEFEKVWEGKLSKTWGEACPVHAALMNYDNIPCWKSSLGSPFELIRYVNGSRGN